MLAYTLSIETVSEFNEGIIVAPEIEYEGIPPDIEKDNDR